MPQDISFSDGSTKRGCILIVMGAAMHSHGHRGHRLAWTNDDGDTYTPALGLTTPPFPTECAAVMYGQRMWGDTAKRLTRRALVPIRR